MINYRALVHYHFKKGMEEKAIKFLENELIKKAKEMGCHNIELIQHGKDSTYVIGVATWNSIEEARKFQEIWEHKERELNPHLANPPKHEFFKIRSVYIEKAKKAA